MIYVIQCPDGSWLSRDGQVLPFADLAAAQMEVLTREPDPIAAGRWHIHPINPGNADQVGLKLRVSYVLEKFDADGNLLETITGEG